MNNISRNKILLTIIGVLLLANIALLIYGFSSEPPVPARQGLGITKMLREEVRFSEAQLQQLEALKKEHWSRMHPLMDELVATKQAYYRNLYSEAPSDSLLRAQAELIGEKQQAVDLQILQHFRRLRALCTEEQRQKFDSLFPAIITKMVSPPPRKKESK